MSKELVDDIFKRTIFDECDRALHAALYNQMKELAKVMDVNAPECADKTLAFRAMHLSLMHYGAALSKKEKYKEVGVK